MQYSTMFCAGEFTRAVKKMGTKKLSEIMAPPPETIDAGANLMEAAYAMVSEKESRPVETKNGEPAGVLREQDLFFEIELILRE